MSRAKRLTDEERAAVLWGREAGRTQAELSDQFGVSQGAISQLLSSMKNRGTVKRAKAHGNPRKTTKKLDQMIVRISRDNPQMTAVDITRDLHEFHGSDVSVWTVRRRLCDAGLHGRRPVTKPLISKKNRLARLKFATEHVGWTPQQWAEVIWTDESKFLLFGSDGRTYVRRPVGTRYDVRYQVPSVEHGGGSVMLWGCFSSRGMGPIHRVNGIMDRNVYLNILETVLYPFARSTFGRSFIVQQDNDPKHCSRLVKQWFDRRRVTLMNWPSQSPDLNPIEHMWEELERRLRHKRAKNADEKYQQLKEEWERIPQAVIDALIESMPRRCQAVIDAKGFST